MYQDFFPNFLPTNFWEEWRLLGMKLGTSSKDTLENLIAFFFPMLPLNSCSKERDLVRRKINSSHEVTLQLKKPTVFGSVWFFISWTVWFLWIFHTSFLQTRHFIGAGKVWFPDSHQEPQSWTSILSTTSMVVVWAWIRGCGEKILLLRDQLGLGKGVHSVEQAPFFWIYIVLNWNLSRVKVEDSQWKDPGQPMTH